jgi:PAS domain S-box-containing protein
MDDCAIMIYDDVDNVLEVQLDMNRFGDTDRITPEGTRYDLAKYPAKLKALKERDVVVIQKDDANTTFKEELEELIKNGDTARMLVPLVVREQSIGLIQLEQTTEDEVVTQQKVRLAKALGSQVAVAIENARLSSQTTAQFEESLLVNELSQAISSSLDLNIMLEVVRDQLPPIIGASELYLALYEQETEEILFPLAVRDGKAYNIPKRQLGDDEVSFIIKHRRPLSLGADYWSPDELRHSLGIKNGEGDVKSYMGVPLVSGDEVAGVIAVRDTQRTRAFTLNEQRILTTVGSQLGAAIQNARLYRRITSFAEDLNAQVAERTHELEEERDRIDTLYQITSELARTLDMDRLMPRALSMVAKAVNAQDGVIVQLDHITDQLFSKAALNPNSLIKNSDGEHDYHPAERLARWLIEEDEHVVLIDDLHESEFWDVDAPGAAEWRSALAVLLETNEELLGVMVVLSKQPNAFVESHLRMMVAAANQVASSINNAELYKLIRDQAERLGSLLRSEQEETEKNKAILEGIADGVVLADSEGRVILFNTAAERILQIARDQAMGQLLGDLTGQSTGTAGEWAVALQNRFANFEDDMETEFIDERVEIGDRIASVHISPVFTGEKFIGSVSVFRDITRDVEADRMKREFVSSISHELRTPLTPIKGFVDMLLMGATGEISDQQKQVLGTIKDNVTRLTSLVEDVLKISKIDAGREKLQLEQLDLNELVAASLEQLQSKERNKTKKLKIGFEKNADAPALEADREKIEKVIMNILDNAFNYTRKGGKISIDIQPDDSDQYVVLSVQDSGVGIPKDFHDRVWLRFERHDETALELDVAGTGLGLPIVRELVEMHGGEVWFESVVDEGTTFYVKLPQKQPYYVAQLGGVVRSNGSD